MASWVSKASSELYWDEAAIGAEYGYRQANGRSPIMSWLSPLAPDNLYAIIVSVNTLINCFYYDNRGMSRHGRHFDWCIMGGWGRRLDATKSVIDLLLKCHCMACRGSPLRFKWLDRANFISNFSLNTLRIVLFFLQIKSFFCRNSVDFGFRLPELSDFLGPIIPPVIES